MGNNEIIQVRLRIHKQTLQARAFERIVNSQEFEDAFEPSPALDLILKSGDCNKLKKWIKDNTPITLETMSFRELRELAKQYRIPKWSRMDTYDLMEALDARVIRSSESPT
jgi:hypothetical protein